ncbi:glutathione synthase [Hydromonas duriensis]|uniref:Glutathione synthetase n=1 Tax=Hydromonas duriensis TaxID=1527608 RepID=A0A4V3DK04_9BURK|nr:glutathione synthase [Hydromonas duriensis]TDR32179.1 glutathione synthase [Hydromonas duriensis]
MHILFIADPLEQFKIHKETTYAMMRAAQTHGHTIWACTSHELFSKGEVQTKATHIELLDEAAQTHWYNVIEQVTQPLHQFDAVIMRKDPPFDVNYVTDTWLLDAAVRQGAKVFNAPSGIRNHSEKVSILEFPEFTAPTLISSDKAILTAFHNEHSDVIFKPLDGMGGSGIFRISSDGMNLGSVIEMLTENGTRPIMAQKFLPAITQGDKRILLIGGQIVPYALARIPQHGEVRGNMAVGGKAVAQPLSESDWRIATALAPILWSRGILLTGLDIIGECVTEINVTSPTGFQEIFNQTGFDVAQLFIEMLEHAVK